VGPNDKQQPVQCRLDLQSIFVRWTRPKLEYVPKLVYAVRDAPNGNVLGIIPPSRNPDT